MIALNKSTGIKYPHYIYTVDGEYCLSYNYTVEDRVHIYPDMIEILRRDWYVGEYLWNLLKHKLYLWWINL